jgi:hypothetical protein
MCSDGNSSDKPTVAELEYVWHEYIYRHDLCWRAVYKVTFAVIALGVIPYQDKLNFGRFAWIPPLIGTLLAAFGIFILRNELTLFAKTKLAHHSLQDRFWDRVLPGADELQSERHASSLAQTGETRIHFFERLWNWVLPNRDQLHVKHGLKPDQAGRTPFDFFVMTYVIALFLLSAANSLVALCRAPWEVSPVEQSTWTMVQLIHRGLGAEGTQ